jgi:hypothetical protein
MDEYKLRIETPTHKSILIESGTQTHRSKIPSVNTKLRYYKDFQSRQIELIENAPPTSSIHPPQSQSKFNNNYSVNDQNVNNSQKIVTNENIIPIDEYYLNYLPDFMNHFDSLPKSFKIEYKIRPEKKNLQVVYAEQKMPVIRPCYDFNETEEIYILKNSPITSARLIGNIVPIPVVSAIRKKKNPDYETLTKKVEFEQTKTPSRHVSLLKDREAKSTNYMGPYGLDTQYYIKNNTYLKSLEYQ